MEPIVRPLGAILVDTALHVMAAGERVTADAIVERLRCGEPEAHGTFRWTLARLLRVALRRDFPALRDLHLIGSTLHGPVRPTSDLDLVVHVADINEPLRHQLDRVADEMSAAYVGLLPGDVHPDFRLVSIQIVTDREVRAREGFAALLSSVHSPSLRVDS